MGGFSDAAVAQASAELRSNRMLNPSPYESYTTEMPEYFDGIMPERPESGHGDDYLIPQDHPQPVENVVEERALRLLVTGSRDWNNYGCIAQALQDIWTANGGRPMVLVSGACPTGADKMAEHVWAKQQFRIEQHPADWVQFGRRAGGIRNREMVESGIDLCVAFIRNGSNGASLTVRLARAKSIPVIEYTLTDLDFTPPKSGAHVAGAVD